MRISGFLMLKALKSAPHLNDTLKNCLVSCVQLECKHKHGAKCDAQLSLPVIDGFFLLNKPYTQGEHRRMCCSMCGVDPPPEDEVV